MKKIGIAGLSTVLSLAFALPVMGQQPQPSAAEVACNQKYTKYYGAQADTKLFDDFLNDATCKDSKYRNDAFTLMRTSLTTAKNWKGVMELATRYEKEMPDASKESKVYSLSQGMTAAAQANDAGKVIEFGDKVIAIDPDNVNALLIVSTTIPMNLSTDAAAMEASMNKAVAMAKKLVAMSRPTAVEEKTWQMAVLAPAHGVIGYGHYLKTQYPEAEAEFDQTVKINPKEQLAWYRYGLSAVKIAITAQDLIAPAYAAVNAITVAGPERDEAIAKRDAIEKDFKDKRDKTIDILISAVALPDANIAKAARATLESLYNPLHDNTNAGLDDLIAKRKAELSK